MNIKKYAHFFENINSSTSIEEYENFFATNVKFKDPFKEVNGIQQVYKIFQDMYIKLENPRFEILETIEQDNFGYIKWNFIYNFKKDTKTNHFQGVSRIEFNKEGKAISHIDYWDAAKNVYEKIPILSFFIKLIKTKFL